MEETLQAERRWHQYSLRTLLLTVTFAAVLCSMGACTRWFMPLGFVAMLLLGGGVGFWIERTRLGFGRGAFVGGFIAWLALVVATAYLYYNASPLKKVAPREPVKIWSAAEALKAIQAAEPSVRGFLELGTAKLEEAVVGQYDEDFMGLGCTKFLFISGQHISLS